MARLRTFYRCYRQYILSDGLMYVVFALALALLFVFFWVKSFLIPCATYAQLALAG